MKKAIAFVLLVLLILGTVSCNQPDKDQQELANEENTSYAPDTNNIKSITFYAYYGGGIGSKVPDENMEEIIQWLQSFALGEKFEDEMLPPGTNTYHVKIEYKDGTVVKEGLDVVRVDGDLYYVKRDHPPACFYEIISKTSID